jgi:hypothetical protein
MKPTKWYTAKTGNHQGLIVAEETGENIAVTYDKANAPLITAACNACMEINPDNPIAVAEALPELVGALGGLFEHCAMVHKHWGDSSNAKEADLAIAKARDIIAKIQAK